MSLVTITSPTTVAGVIHGDVQRPLVGVWTADLVIDQPDGSGFDPGTRVTIKASNGFTLGGTVDPHRAADFLGTIHVRVIGGAGGMSKDASARSFVQPGAYMRDVLNALATDSGEQLSLTIDAGLMGTNLAAWSVVGGNMVMRNLRALLDISNAQHNAANDWRILADGTLWVGTDTWPKASGQFEVLDFNPQDASYLLGVDSPFVVPGTELPNIGRVARVRDSIEDGKLRSRVWVEIPDIDRGPSYAIQQMARQALPGVDYHALYLCEVVTQSSDLTQVDIRPLGARNEAMIGGLQRVPVRFGTGIKVQVNPGATVLLGWDGGNPEGPYVCCGLSSQSPQSIQLGGDTPVSRQGDHSDVGTLVLNVAGTSVLSGTYTDPDGTTITIANGVTIPLKAKLSEGSSIVGAG